MLREITINSIFTMNDLQGHIESIRQNSFLTNGRKLSVINVTRRAYRLESINFIYNKDRPCGLKASPRYQSSLKKHDLGKHLYKWKI